MFSKESSPKKGKHEWLRTWKLPVQRKQILYLHNSYNIWKKRNHIVQFQTIVNPQSKVFPQSNQISTSNSGCKYTSSHLFTPVLPCISSKYSQCGTLRADRSPLWTTNITTSSCVYVETSPLSTLDFKMNHHISWALFAP